LSNSEQHLLNHRKAKKFVELVKKELKEYNMKLVFGRGEMVNGYKCRCSGYFDEEKVVVASKNRHWLSVLVHEYSHFLQWKKRDEEYEDMFINGKDCNGIIDDWLDGEEYRPSTIEKAFIKVRRMEKTCDMIALSLIRKYKLPINEEYFTRHANCHVYYYHMMERTRKRYVNDEMFYNIMVHKAMPKTFKCKNIRYMPEKIYKIARRAF